ncbi:GIY-YIG nuclease family protein [Inquilinus sp. CAU 1745]|uniref:GIY-YIG nuclease family protein n=1 Tax=Inquilinus sp. CAU 1745 TaxID=3140369 RepID=UPI00325AB922
MTAEPPIPSPGYGEFEIDIPAVFRRQLPEILEKIPAAPLVLENVTALPEKAQGGYVLMMDGKRVYVGKTDAAAGFQSRLRRHWKNIQHRVGLNPERVTFKAVRIMVFHNFDVEDILIKRFAEIDGKPLIWNNSGFGSNDPGHNREGQEPAAFDMQYPIDIDRPIDIGPGERSILALLLQLKGGLPYLFRYETDLAPTPSKPHKTAHFRTGHANQRDTRITLPKNVMTMREIMTEMINTLPDGWLCTVFPDRVILYKEPTRYNYARGTIP